LTYEDSKEKCKSLGMEIASFDSRSEAQQVFDAAVKLTDIAWVGIKRGWDGDFVNMEGETVDLPWARGEPSNAGGKEKCVILSKRRNGYNDVRCDFATNFVCQIVG
jgi:Lectin C-type domain